MLKGDPVSGTSLLSTSVQTVMLVGRVLDEPARPISDGAYGTRTFAFSDKLDVINRWFHIERDAETESVLSKYRVLPRGLDDADRRRRSAAGQNWAIAAQIGHNLNAPLRIGLTSSQYQGVQENADLVIATSALEVGYNDPTVGAVVQHKAPRSLASFLQRKGRAGRTRAMRPWMVVVTSAYGRDRWAFQHAENLFAPTLPPLDLSLDNYYVRKIQASYALMDWLALTLKTSHRTLDVWDALRSDERSRGNYWRSQRSLIRSALEAVLDGSRLDDLSSYLRQALGLGDDMAALQSLLWEEPRSLLFEVIPTLVRQLGHDWQRVVDGQPQAWSDTIGGAPMPDFVPATLFGDLNVPELLLRIPDAPTTPPTRASGGRYGRRGRGGRGVTPQQQVSPSTTSTASPEFREDAYLALAQGLVEFAPGHVNKRFAAKERTDEAHWLALPDEAQLSRGVLPLQYLALTKDDVPIIVSVDDTTYHVYRPRTYTLAVVPPDVKNTSSARLSWRSHLAPRSAAGALATDGAGVALTLV